MTTPITLPLWLFLLLLVLAAWSLLSRLLLPGGRWFLRRRINRVIDELNSRLAIQLQPFKLTRRKVLLDRLIYDPQVQEAADAFSREEKVPRDVVQGKVRRYAREIVPAFNAYLYFRLAYWVGRTVARWLYRVRLGSANEAELAAIAPSATVVFVMNHRSNMDYVLVSYLVAGRSALSYAVGEWARIWPLESLIRAMGAYFVRRRSRNALYRRVLQRYVQMATAAGVTQAVYPEGRLSRDGRLEEPKLGLLDYMLRDFDPQGDRDLVFLPVGLNYDRTLEDRTLLLDVPEGAAAEGGSALPERRRGLAAVTRTAGFLLRNLRLRLLGRWYRFGYACVSFGSPISMRAWLEGQGVDFRRLDREQRFARIEHLAVELMAAIGRAVPVLPVALVATVFVHAPREELGQLEVQARCQEWIDRFETAGAQVYVPRKDRAYALEVGLRMLVLRHLIDVDERSGLYRARPEEMKTLRYYANSIAHFSAG